MNHIASVGTESVTALTSVVTGKVIPELILQATEERVVV
jgi:hypothetical protein